MRYHPNTGFHFFPWGTILRGWGLIELGEGEVGIAQMREGLRLWEATAGWHMPYFLTPGRGISTHATDCGRPYGD